MKSDADIEPTHLLTILFTASVFIKVLNIGQIQIFTFISEQAIHFTPQLLEVTE